MSYTPSRGRFEGREFESRAEYRRETAVFHREERIDRVIEETHGIAREAHTIDPDIRGESSYNYMAGVAVDLGRYPNERMAQFHLSGLYREAVSESFDKRAHGAYARWLEAVGVRVEDSDYDVGDTPGHSD